MLKMALIKLISCNDQTFTAAVPVHAYKYEMSKDNVFDLSER
jgi:hypothetical protein